MFFSHTLLFSIFTTFYSFSTIFSGPSAHFFPAPDHLPGLFGDLGTAPPPVPCPPICSGPLGGEVQFCRDCLELPHLYSKRQKIVSLTCFCVCMGIILFSPVKFKVFPYFPFLLLLIHFTLFY